MTIFRLYMKYTVQAYIVLLRKVQLQVSPLENGHLQVIHEIQGAYKLSEYSVKPYFHKYWSQIQYVTTIWKRNVCSFIVIQMHTCQIDGLVVQWTQTTPSTPSHPGHQTWQCVISSCGVSSRTMFTSHHFQRHYRNSESPSTQQSGTSHQTCLRGFPVEWEYRLEICRATWGGHIECI